MKLDPDDFGYRRGAWYFLAGKILTEMRHTRSFSEMPSDEEVALLERSLEKDPHLIHLPFLGDVYREIVKARQRSSSQNRKVQYFNQILLSKSKELYERCVKDESATHTVLTSCGMGLIKLPKSFRNVELAEEAFQKAMKTGGRRATIGMGYLYNWCKGDYREALKYFEKAHSEEAYRAGLEIIKMKYKIDDNYNPLEDCDRFIKELENMMEARQKVEITVAYIMVKAEYLLVKRNDFLAALQQWKIAMNLSDESKYLWESKCLFWSNSGVKLCDLMCKRIRMALEERRYVGTEEKHLRETLSEFLPHCKDYQDRGSSWRRRE